MGTRMSPPASHPARRVMNTPLHIAWMVHCSLWGSVRALGIFLGQSPTRPVVRSVRTDQG